MEKPAAETHKRQKIQDSNQTMFLWIAGMAAVVGLFGVVAWFLFQQVLFKAEVVGLKNQTVKTLQTNNEAATQLRDNLRAFETNNALRSSRVDDSQGALSVIIDALPSTANPSALGASLQQRLIAGVPNLTLESLAVTPSGPSLTSTVAPASNTSGSAAGSTTTVPFSLVVSSSDPNSLKEMLTRFEHSIRIIDIDSLSLERSDKLYTMTIQAHAYYEPAKVIELREEVKKPK